MTSDANVNPDPITPDSNTAQIPDTRNRPLGYAQCVGTIVVIFMLVLGHPYIPGFQQLDRAAQASSTLCTTDGQAMEHVSLVGQTGNDRFKVRPRPIEKDSKAHVCAAAQDMPAGTYETPYGNFLSLKAPVGQGESLADHFDFDPISSGYLSGFSPLPEKANYTLVLTLMVLPILIPLMYFAMVVYLRGMCNIKGHGNIVDLDAIRKWPLMPRSRKAQEPEAAAAVNDTPY